MIDFDYNYLKTYELSVTYELSPCGLVWFSRSVRKIADFDDAKASVPVHADHVHMMFHANSRVVEAKVRGMWIYFSFEARVVNFTNCK